MPWSLFWDYQQRQCWEFSASIVKLETEHNGPAVAPLSCKQLPGASNCWHPTIRTVH